MITENIPAVIVYLMLYTFWLAPFCFSLCLLKTIHCAYSKVPTRLFSLLSCLCAVWLLISGAFLSAVGSDRVFSPEFSPIFLVTLTYIAVLTGFLAPVCFVLSLIRSINKIIRHDTWLVSALVTGLCLLWLLFTVVGVFSLAAASPWEALPSDLQHNMLQMV